MPEKSVSVFRGECWALESITVDRREHQETVPVRVVVRYRDTAFEQTFDLSVETAEDFVEALRRVLDDP